MKELVIIDIDANSEVESLVSFVDNFEVMELGYSWGTSMKSVCLESLPTIMR